LDKLAEILSGYRNELEFHVLLSMRWVHLTDRMPKVNIAINGDQRSLETSANGTIW
jgi:hypothetical protein